MPLQNNNSARYPQQQQIFVRRQLDERRNALRANSGILHELARDCGDRSVDLPELRQLIARDCRTAGNVIDDQIALIDALRDLATDADTIDAVARALYGAHAKSGGPAFEHLSVDSRAWFHAAACGAIPVIVHQLLVLTRESTSRCWWG